MRGGAREARAVLCAGSAPPRYTKQAAQVREARVPRAAACRQHLPQRQRARPRQRPQLSRGPLRSPPTWALQTVCPLLAPACHPAHQPPARPRRFLLQLVGVLLEDIATKQPRVEMSEQQHTFYCQELGTLLMCLIHIFKSGGCRPGPLGGGVGGRGGGGMRAHLGASSCRQWPGGQVVIVTFTFCVGG